MVAYARGGRRSHALRQFLECRRALVDQLGVEPAADTTNLQRASSPASRCERASRFRNRPP